MVTTAREKSETTAPAHTGKHGVREGNEETQTCKWHDYGKMGYCEVTVHFGEKWTLISDSPCQTDPEWLLPGSQKPFLKSRKLKDWKRTKSSFCEQTEPIFCSCRGRNDTWWPVWVWLHTDSHRLTSICCFLHQYRFFFFPPWMFNWVRLDTWFERSNQAILKGTTNLYFLSQSHSHSSPSQLIVNFGGLILKIVVMGLIWGYCRSVTVLGSGEKILTSPFVLPSPLHLCVV